LLCRKGKEYGARHQKDITVASFKYGYYFSIFSEEIGGKA
jgi:hypothetical protein